MENIKEAKLAKFKTQKNNLVCVLMFAFFFFLALLFVLGFAGFSVELFILLVAACLTGIILGIACIVITNKISKIEKEIGVEANKTKEPNFEEPNIPEPTVFDSCILDEKKKEESNTLSVTFGVIGIVILVGTTIFLSISQLVENWMLDGIIFGCFALGILCILIGFWTSKEKLNKDTIKLEEDVVKQDNFNQ